VVVEANEAPGGLASTNVTPEGFVSLQAIGYKILF
jgi:hypothetical protein